MKRSGRGWREMLKRANALASAPSGIIDEDTREFVMRECDEFHDRCHCAEIAASLALDGMPAHWLTSKGKPKRKGKR